jgi:uncharacterized membrane protein YbhN (UPF0104 family)
MTSPAARRLDDALTPPAQRARWKRLAVLVTSLGALAFVAWMVPFRDVCTDKGCAPGLLSTLSSARLGELSVLLVVYVAGILCWAGRWRALLAVLDVRVGFVDLFRLTLESQAGAVLLPGGVAGDALRIAYVRAHANEARTPLASVVATILADRIIGLGTLATVALAAAATTGARGLGPALPILVVLPIGILVGAWALRHPRVLAWKVLRSGRAETWLKPLVAYAAAPASPAAFARAAVYSLGVSAVQLAVFRGILHAIHATVASEGWASAGTTFGFIVAALPALPGAWGTADAAFVAFLAPAGVSAPSAAAACMLYRIFWYASGSLGALSALARRPR